MNTSLFYALYGVAPSQGVLAPFIIFFAEYFPFVVCAGLLLPLFLKKEGRWGYLKTLVIISAITVFSWVLSSGIKHAFPSSRPYILLSDVHPLFMPGDNGSFPSGHTTAFSTLAFTFYFFGYKRMGIALLVSALLIGSARVISGVHFPLDIVGGVFLGLCIALVAYLLKKRFWGETFREV